MDGAICIVPMNPHKILYHLYKCRNSTIYDVFPLRNHNLEVGMSVIGQALLGI